jgi:hypothetical protein
MSCLRFLGLIDDKDHVSDKLRSLVKAYKTDTWQQTLASVINDAYRNIIRDIDLQTGTDAQLDISFRKYGNVDGQMLDKATRFYLYFLKEAGVKYSPFFGVRKPAGKRSGNGKSTSKKAGTPKNDPLLDEDEDDELPDDSTGGKIERFRFPIRGKGHGIIVFPAEMNKNDWMTVRAMLDAYFGANDPN